MRYSAIVRGAREERVVSVSLPGVDGKIEIALRALTAGEEADVLKGALSFAKEKGVTSPAAGDPIFDLGVMAYTLSIGLRDAGGEPGKRGPFFDGGVDQILDPQNGPGRDVLVYLFEHHEAWQDECSPYVRSLSDAELGDRVRELAEATDAGPLVALRPSLRWICMRSMASQLLLSRVPRSSSGSPGGTHGNPSPSAHPSSSATEGTQADRGTP